MIMRVAIFFQVRDSEITGDVVEQLKKVSPKLTAIIEAHGESDPALLGELFKVGGGN